VSRPQVVTLTAHPSLDRTLELPGPLARGTLTRLGAARTEPGGKGVNVARALAAAGADVLAVLPAAADDPLLTALRALGLPVAAVPIAGPVRTNHTLTEPDGTTTKLNEPGPELDAAALAALQETLLAAAASARWVVLAGSLPPGVPVDWYADLVRTVRGAGARIAVDTSEAPLRALVGAGPAAAPDLLTPNTAELAQLAGTTEAALLADPDAVRATVGRLHGLGVTEVLLTRGADGAELSTVDGGRWSARPHAVAVRSTVGAGDSSLAGYLLADLAGAAPAARLRSAVAHGTAAAALPGSAVPTPAQVGLVAVDVRAGELSPGRPTTAGARRAPTTR
jgi:1-phosphofructokinase